MNQPCLQIWSEWSTIVGTILTVLLTLIVIYLTVRDKQKTESIKELKEQTKTLLNTFIELIKPNFTVDRIINTLSPQYFDFHYKNVGGHCYNLTIPNIGKLIEEWDINLLETESFSSQSVYQGYIHIPYKKFVLKKEYSLIFNFFDVQGSKYSQTLIFSTDESSSEDLLGRTEVKNIFFKPPVLLD